MVLHADDKASALGQYSATTGDAVAMRQRLSPAWHPLEIVGRLVHPVHHSLLSRVDFLGPEGNFLLSVCLGSRSTARY